MYSIFGPFIIAVTHRINPSVIIVLYVEILTVLYSHDAVIEGSFTFRLARQTPPDGTSPHNAVDFVVFTVGLNQEQKPNFIIDIKDDR